MKVLQLDFYRIFNTLDFNFMSFFKTSQYEPISRQTSSKDVVLSKLKKLQPGQNAKPELIQRNLVQELLDREIKTNSKLELTLDQDEEVDNLSDEQKDFDDETEDLLKELEKIKKEKEHQKMKIQEAEERTRSTQMVNNNPLISFNSTNSLEQTNTRVKRHWKDDCIFKNQTQLTTESNSKTFVNDVLRSSRHKSFMQKYIK